MNRTNAPDRDESESIERIMRSEDIIDFIDRDPNKEFALPSSPEETVSVITRSTEEENGENSSDAEVQGMDPVSLWIESDAPAVSEELRSSLSNNYVVDGAIVPMKHEVWDRGLSKMIFLEGVKKMTGARDLRFHDPTTLSLAYLDTAEEGILHVIPGWTRREVIEDIAYRFKAGNVMKADIPFLGGSRCEKRSYHCQGVLVCSKSTAEFRGKAHNTVEDCDEDAMKTVSIFEETEIMKRNALHIFREVRSRRKYCVACVCSPGGVPNTCEGSPVIRERRGDILYGSKYFLECTGYAKALELRHFIRKLDSLDEEGIGYLRGLLSGAITPPDIDRDEEYTYVHGKKMRCSTLCKVHKEPLRHVPCTGHVMNVFEPVPQADVDVPKMVYVSCFRTHTHPPPPPPDHTLRKMKLLEAEAEVHPSASAAVLRKRVEEKILASLNTVGRQKFKSGTAHVPPGSGGRKVRRLKQSKRKVVTEVEGLMALAIDEKFPYCRDIKIVGSELVVTCAHDAMLMHAALCSKFAGDATYKTVGKATTGRWYLYNIVAPARRDGGNSKGLVVFRALMTGLSADDYRVVWRCFFRELITCADIIRGEEVPGSGVLRVPYQELPPALITRSCFVSSVTMDFDAAEVQGCAQALADICGGSVASHIRGMMIGCGVHLERDLRKRSQDSRAANDTTLSCEARLRKYTAFVASETENEAEGRLEEINEFDPQWVKWVKTSGISPLLCKQFSRMSPAHRADGYEDTNVVESQNNRGNVLAGKYLHPFDAVNELGKLDMLDIKKVDNGLHDELRGPRAPRQRSDHTLAPSGSSGGYGRKRRNVRRNGGMGPAPKRACMSQPSRKTTLKSRGEDDEVEVVKETQKSDLERNGVPFIIYMRVQRMLCQLEMKTMSHESIPKEAKDRRSEALTTLLIRITEVDGSDTGALKALILQARLGAIRCGDTDFGCELFKVYSEGCLSEDPLASTS